MNQLNTVNLGDFALVGERDDGNAMGVGEVQEPLVGVHVIEGERHVVGCQNSVDPQSSVDSCGCEIGDAFNADVLGERGPHPFPPVGWKLVLPGACYERTPDDVVRLNNLPHDPKRTARVVRSSDFAPDGTPISERGRKIVEQGWIEN